MPGNGASGAPTVSFITMAEGTREDYEPLARFEEEFAAGLADRVLAQLQARSGSLAGHQADRLEHSLQTAPRSFRDGAAFDPAYESLPLEFFEPMVRRVFARKPYSLAPREHS